jgi:hypothetical protein
MAFQGSLTELHLPDIIQLISVSGKNGVFHLVDGEMKGQIYLHDGQIVHAQIEDTSGEEAVYTLAIWRRGDFRFEPGKASEIRTISKSNTNLLMEAARRLDEWRVLSKKVPSTDMVPEFVVQENREGQINLNTSEWLVLSKIDGQRNIKELAVACGLSVFDAAKILYGLVATGLLSLKSAPETAPPLPPATKASSQPASAPAKSAPQSPAGGPAPPELLLRLGRVRDVCNGLLGTVGESVVNKHYQRARAEIERGAGSEAIDEAVSQIARAASILKGPSTTEALLEQLKTIQ